MKLFKRMISTFLIVMITVLIFTYSFQSYSNVESFLQYKKTFFAFIEQNYFYAVLLFIGGHSFASIFPLPPTAVTTMVGGIFFGIIPGMLYSLVGAVIGASVNFFTARYLLGKKMHETYKEELKDVYNNIKRNGHWYILSIRLFPFMPLSLSSLLLGVTTIKYRTFLWSTALGLIPPLTLYSLTGYELGSKTEGISKSSAIIIGLCTISVLIICFVFLKQYFAQKRSKQN